MMIALVPRIRAVYRSVKRLVCSSESSMCLLGMSTL